MERMNWPTTGLYKGKFGIRSFIEYIGFSINTWIEGVKIEKRVSNAVVKTQTVKTVDSFSTISFDSAKKIMRRSRRSFWKVVITIRIVLDLIWNIPWKKIFKLLIVVVFVPCFLIVCIFGAVLTIRYEIYKNQRQQEDFEIFRNRYKNDMEEVYILNNAKLEQLEYRMTELEQKQFMYDHKIPIYIKRPKRVEATLMTGKNKGKVVEIEK
jgi:hypothetical protein